MGVCRSSDCRRAYTSLIPELSVSEYHSQSRVEKATFAMGAACSAEGLFGNPYRRDLPAFISIRVGVATGVDPDVVAEAVEITYDPDGITYETLLTQFFNAHDRWAAPDPRQPRFAYAVFAHSHEQRAEAERVREEFVPLDHPPGGDDQPRPVTSLICDATGFEPAPEADQRIIFRMMSAIDANYRPAAEEVGASRLLPLPLVLDHQPGDKKRFDDFRALTQQIGGCLDATTSDREEQAPSFVERIFAMLRHDPRQVGHLSGALRSWLATRPSSGLADRQLDVRSVEVGVKLIDAESYVRFNRTDSSLWIVSTLVPGYSGSNGVAALVRRRAVTDRDSDGRVIDSVVQANDRRRWLVFGTQRQPAHAMPPAVEGDEGRWWEHIGPAEMPISCYDGSVIHTVRWSRGRIEAPATAGLDDSRERTLSELGAPTCDCWALLDAWNPALVLQRFHERSVYDISELADWWKATSVADPEPGWVFEVPKIDPQLWALFHQRVGDHSKPPTRVDLPATGGVLDEPFAPPATDQAMRAVQHLVTGLIPRQLPSLETRWLLTSLAWLTEHHDQLGPDDRTNYAQLIFRHIEQPLLEALWLPCR